MEEIKSLAVVESEVRVELELVAVIAKNAREFEVKGNADVQIAKDNIILLRTKAKEIEAIRLISTKPLDDMKKAIKGEYDKPINILNTALKVYNDKMTTWLDAEAKKAWEESRKLQAKADESARKEKEKLEAKAKKLDEKGKPERADALREQKEEIVPEVPVVNSAPELPKGSYWKITWSAQVIDVDKIPREYMLPNYEGLNKIAMATKGLIRITGVVFKAEKKLISRS